jgi:hypothetical protein
MPVQSGAGEKQGREGGKGGGCLSKVVQGKMEGREGGKGGVPVQGGAAKKARMSVFPYSWLRVSRLQRTRRRNLLLLGLLPPLWLLWLPLLLLLLLLGLMVILWVLSPPRLRAATRQGS